MVKEILNKVRNEEELNREEIIALLDVDTTSSAFYELIDLSNTRSRKAYGHRGLVFGQIGLEARSCSGNCKFCNLASDTFSKEEESEKELEEILDSARGLVAAGAKEVFLMVMAEYSEEKYLNIARAVREVLPEEVNMVGNMGDFDLAYANKLKEVGFKAMYHICRLREGVDTDIRVEDRVKTLEAIKEAGLELYYCVEPIGPEHESYELADEIIRAKDYPVTVMAAMRRVPVPGTPLAVHGEISSAHLAKVVAVANLVVKPSYGMGVHEPNEMSLIAGTNQIYAEVGVNPRDVEQCTEKGRGFSVEDAKIMLQRAEWEI